MHQLVFENSIHQMLKCGWSIRHPEWHNQKFELAPLNSECTFVNICILHRNLVIS